MEQISDIWYSEDCRVSAVELEGGTRRWEDCSKSVSIFGLGEDDFRVIRRR